MFRNLDADDSGTLSLSELYQLLKSLNIECTEAEVKRQMDSFDDDASGCLE